MAPTQSLRVLRHQVHLSYSQINTYLTCSLRSYFHYVKGYAPEHVSASTVLPMPYCQESRRRSFCRVAVGSAAGALIRNSAEVGEVWVTSGR